MAYERATPVEMRKALKVVDLLKNGGVLFVPLPVLNKQDHDVLIEDLDSRLMTIETLCSDYKETSHGQTNED